MRKILCLIATLIACGAAGVAAENKPRDAFGKPDRIIVEIAPLSAKGQWAVGVLLENDEELAAITVPLRFGEFIGQFRLDSVLFTETRVTYFSLKITNSSDTLNTVLIGLLASLGDNRPPLEPGYGPVARLYFTEMKDKKKPPTLLVIDSTFFPPYNTLELVTPGAEPIQPTFETVQVEQLTKLGKSKKSKLKTSPGKTH